MDSFKTSTSIDDGVLEDDLLDEDDSGESVRPECGNGIIEGDEVCDDGNEIMGDGCSFCEKSGTILWEVEFDGVYDIRSMSTVYWYVSEQQKQWETSLREQPSPQKVPDGGRSFASGFALAGQTKGDGGRWQGWLGKIDAEGNLVHQETWWNADSEVFTTGVIEHQSDDLFVAGYRQSENNDRTAMLWRDSEGSEFDRFNEFDGVESWKNITDGPDGGIIALGTDREEGKHAIQAFDWDLNPTGFVPSVLNESGVYLQQMFRQSEESYLFVGTQEDPNSGENFSQFWIGSYLIQNGELDWSHLLKPAYDQIPIGIWSKGSEMVFASSPRLSSVSQSDEARGTIFGLTQSEGYRYHYPLGGNEFKSVEITAVGRFDSDDGAAYEFVEPIVFGRGIAGVSTDHNGNQQIFLSRVNMAGDSHNIAIAQTYDPKVYRRPKDILTTYNSYDYVGAFTIIVGEYVEPGREDELGKGFAMAIVP